MFFAKSDPYAVFGRTDARPAKRKTQAHMREESRKVTISLCECIYIYSANPEYGHLI